MPASFLALRHVGSPANVGEPEMAGATFGGPVHTGEPDDGPDADADHLEIPFDDEPDDAVQDGVDEEYPVVRSGAMRQRLGPDSEVDRGFDLYVEDLDFDEGRRLKT